MSATLLALATGLPGLPSFTSFSGAVKSGSVNPSALPHLASQAVQLACGGGGGGGYRKPARPGTTQHGHSWTVSSLWPDQENRGLPPASPVLLL